MGEILIPTFRVYKDNLSNHDTGGAYRVTLVDIWVDSSLPIKRQAVAATHEVLAAYLQAVVAREDIEEIAESIVEVLGEVLFRESPMEGIEDD